MADYINYNGELLSSDEPIVSANNRGLRYGDGVFETMRMVNGRIPLWALHMERLFEGLKQLKFELPLSFSPEKLLEQTEALCKKNSTTEAARVRFMLFRGNGGLYDPEDLQPNFVIQSWNIDRLSPLMTEDGLSIDIYPDARKSCDKFSNLKLNSFHPYVMAANFAKEHQLNDCLVLNSNDRISDSTIANVFCVQNGIITTPPLSEGCVAGVMRRWLLENRDSGGYNIKEGPISIDDLQEADEIFLSNAVQGIRWVKQFSNKSYSNEASKALYQFLYKNVFLR